MMRGYASTCSRSALFAASVTVLAAVGYDVAAGKHLSQALLLGGLATVVAGLRVLLDSRYRSLFAALSGAVVTLPALHLAAAVATPLTTDAPLDSAHLVGSDLPLTAGQLVTAGVLVSIVMSSERAFLLAATVLTGILCVSVPRTPRTFTGAPVPLPAIPPLHDPLCRRHHSRRGPPANRVLVLP